VLTQTTGMLILGGLAALPLAMALDGFLWPTWPMDIAVQSAAIMLLINAVMMFMFVWVARTIGPVFASMTANVITLAGVLWGWVIFQETPSPWIWAAMVAMALGVALVTLRRATPVAR
jgi:drug/metabolite transporter (DMT)-like permease